MGRCIRGGFLLHPQLLNILILLASVDKRTGQAVAIKIIDVENAEDEVEDIIQEISILSELHSPYVTRYHGSFLRGSDLWIIMEFCSGGSCADLLKPGLIHEEYITIIIRELLMGLEYLHGDKKLHRDIKGMAIISHPNGRRLKLGDCSCKCPAGSKWSSQIGRLWGIWPIVRHNDEEEHVRGYSVLDGAGSHQAVWLRPQSGHLVTRDYSVRARQWRTALLGHPSHESSVLDSQKPSPKSARQL